MKVMTDAALLHAEPVKRFVRVSLYRNHVIYLREWRMNGEKEIYEKHLRTVFKAIFSVLIRTESKFVCCRSC